MTVLSPAQIAGHAHRAGFRGKGLVNAVAVALAESGGNPQAVNVNTDRYRSRDRGLWQINSHWHPEVSDAQAFNPASAAAAAYRISQHGTTWKQWATWPVAAGAQHTRAVQGVQTFLRTGGGVSGSTGAGANLPNPGGSTGQGDGGVPWPAGLAVDAITGVVGAAATPVDVARQGVLIFAKAGLWMADPHNWLRVAFVVGGSVAVLAGLGMLAKSGAAGQTAQSAANAAKGGVELGLMAATGGTSAAVKGGAAVVGATAKSAGKGTAAAAGQAAKLVTAK